MYIEVSSCSAANELLEALRDAECLVRPRGRQGIEIVSAYPLSPFECEETAPADQARVETRFFVRAWLASRPGVAASVVG
jgi:hypothetical protein